MGCRHAKRPYPLVAAGVPCKSTSSLTPLSGAVFHRTVSQLIGKSVLGSCGLGILELKGTVVVGCNATAQGLLGFGQWNQGVGADWMVFFSPKNRGSIQQWLASVQAGSTEQAWEGELSPAGREPRWFRIHHGNFGEANLLFLEDISEAKARLATIVANQNHFHALIERSAEGISIFDGKANIVYESPANKRIHGYESEEMNGRNLFDFCHPDDRVRVMPVLQRIAEKPGNVDTDIVRFRHKKGHYIYLEGTVLNALDDPRINGMVNNFRDVTGRLEAERELKQAKEAAEQAHRLQKHFLANLTHEFKTPLTLVRQPLIDLARIPADSAEADSLRALIHRNLDRLDNLISDLIDLSIIDSGEFSLRAKCGNFAQFLREQKSLFDRHAAEKKIQLSLAAPEVITAYFDTGKMASVVGNLLSNAMKFTSSGGSISVKAVVENDGQQDPGFVRVSVKDTGLGMTPEVARRVFDRFFQAQVEDNREFEGMGIGLSITREMVELHGGHIEVVSTPGKGSEFNFTLPMGVGHLNPDDIDTSETPEPLRQFVPVPNNRSGIDATGRNSDGVNLPKLLLVEDNRDMSSFLRLHLESRYSVVAVSNGEEAVVWLKDGRPDLILSDVMMPRMDGLALCRKLRSKGVSIPILLLSAKGGTEQRVEGLRAGANDYLPKPFAIEELLVRLEKLLPVKTAPALSSADDKCRERIVEIIDRQMSKVEFGVSALAKAMGSSERQLQRTVLDLLGVTPSALIRERRLLRAKALIESQAFHTLGEVAAEVGFASSYLSRAYRAQFGSLPMTQSGK